MNEEKTITSPIKAIRQFCLDCCGGSSNEVKNCTSQICVLKPFRFGKNPYNKRTMTDEQREQARERMIALAEKRRAGE